MDSETSSERQNTKMDSETSSERHNLKPNTSTITAINDDTIEELK